jgi:putative ABC transport system permease protein
MHNLLTDLRYALRTLRNAPGFAAATVLTVALGISVNTVMFSVVNTVLLQPLPYPDSGRIVAMYETEPELPKAPVTMPDLIDWRERSRSFEVIASLQPGFRVLTGDERPQRLPVLAVTTDFFDMIGVHPYLGRGFSSEEGQKGRDNVIILTDELFQERFGGDRSIIGRPIRIDGAPVVVVGVTPPGFRISTRWKFPYLACTPMVLEKNESRRGSHDRLAIGRLKSGVSLEQAQSEMTAIAAQLEREHPASNGKIGAKLVPLQADITGGIREVLFALLGAVGFVLLIACANVANLLLARGVSRRQELAIRAAMGAGRWRISRQLLTESIVVALVGGAAGLALAYGGVAAVRHIESLNIARLTDVSVDPTVLLFSTLITAAAGLLFGLAPAFLQSRCDLNTELRQSTERTVAGSGRASALRSVLVAAELSLAVILLIGAGLMIRSVGRLLSTPLGFRPDGVLTAQISLPGRQYDSEEKTAVFVRTLLERVRAIPGVTAASVANKIPLKGGQNGTMLVEGQTWSGGDMEGPLVESSQVYPGYFEALGIPLVQGRLFTDADIRKDFTGLIVNETFVRVMLKNQNPLGKRVSYSKNPPHWQEIVGVVRDTRQHGLAVSALPEVYGLSASSFLTLVVHTRLDPQGLTNSVRRALVSVDRDLPLAEVHTMRDIVDLSSATNRTFMRLITAFAGVALVLACIGIYGVVAFAMSQRRHEIGIRMALGATPGRVVGMALGSAAKLIVTGIVAGVGGAYLVTQYLKAALYEVSPLDPVTFASVPLLLALVAFAASFIPSFRASSLDPLQALHHE